MPDDEESAPPDDGGQADAGGPPPGHQIRFVARTLDGMEVSSAPIALDAGEGSSVQAKVAIAYWGHGEYRAGQTAYACAAAHGADGAVIRFTIKDGGGKSLATLSARVQEERAVAPWTVPASLAKGTKVKFTAETAFSKKDAMEFTVAAGNQAEPEPEQHGEE